MLEIYDTCNIGLRAEPNGGVVLMFTNITGRDDIALMVPIEGKERAQELIDGMQELVGPRVQTANLQDLKKVTHDQGQSRPAAT